MTVVESSAANSRAADLLRRLDVLQVVVPIRVTLNAGLIG
jgi:hypothetical protein